MIGKDDRKGNQVICIVFKIMAFDFFAIHMEREYNYTVKKLVYLYWKRSTHICVNSSC